MLVHSMKLEAKLNSNVVIKDLGSGIVLFENAVLFDETLAFNTFCKSVEAEHSKMYKPTFNPETGGHAYLNKSGYIFDENSLNSMPKRASAIYQSNDNEIITFLENIEKIKDECLLEYFILYPYSYNCVWWKVKGHIVSYENGAYLGAHSDISAEYIYGVHKTSNELALRNVISTVTYINSADTNSPTSFSGGNHVFIHHNIDITPRSGNILFFPSNYVAAHKINPTENGVRLSYLGWYSQGTPNVLVGEDVVDPLKNPEVAKISTNVYLPTIREDYRNLLKRRGFGESSIQYSVTNIGAEANGL